MKKYKFAGTPQYNDGEQYFIYKGVNLMANQDKWVKDTNQESIELYIGEENKKFNPCIYHIDIHDELLTFAAGEISNGVWGFALLD